MVSNDLVLRLIGNINNGLITDAQLLSFLNGPNRFSAEKLLTDIPYLTQVDYDADPSDLLDRVRCIGGGKGYHTNHFDRLKNGGGYNTGQVDVNISFFKAEGNLPSTDEVLRQMKEAGVQPAGLREFLCWGAQHGKKELGEELQYNGQPVWLVPVGCFWDDHQIAYGSDILPFLTTTDENQPYMEERHATLRWPDHAFFMYMR